MMWHTRIARAIEFNESFDGYANSEDLEFSPEMARWGRLRIAGNARFLHAHDPAGRPDPFRFGFCGVRNAFAIHRGSLIGRRARDKAWLTYAFGLDTVLQCTALLQPPGPVWRIAYIRGRIAGLTTAVWRQFLRRRPDRQ